MHPVPTMEWREGSLRLLDQRLLPSREEYIDCTTVADLAEAIRTLAVRGAPAIGIAAAYGAVIALQEAGDSPGWNDRCLGLMDVLASTRPTAVNLFNCLDIQRETLKKGLSRAESLHELTGNARRMFHEDLDASRKMGRLGAGLLSEGCTVLTHCTPAAWPPPVWEPPWRWFTKPMNRVSSRAFSPTRPDPFSRGPGLPPGNCPGRGYR